MQEEKDLFSGLWRLNTGNSTFDSNHRPSEGTMRFERESDGYVMRAEGVTNGKHIREYPLRFILDGLEHPLPEAPGMTATSSQPDRYTLHTAARSEQGIAGEGAYVVSADGKTLTVTLNGTDREQRAFRSTVIWDKVENE